MVRILWSFWSFSDIAACTESVLDIVNWKVDLLALLTVV